MTAQRWPDVTDDEPAIILCPECQRPTKYAFNTDRYVCERHGPVVTGEALPRHRGGWS